MEQRKNFATEFWLTLMVTWKTLLLKIPRADVQDQDLDQDQSLHTENLLTRRSLRKTKKVIRNFFEVSFVKLTIFFLGSKKTKKSDEKSKKNSKSDEEEEEEDSEPKNKKSKTSEKETKEKDNKKVTKSKSKEDKEDEEEKEEKDDKKNKKGNLEISMKIPSIFCN